MPVVVQQRSLPAAEAGWSGSVTLDQADPASGIQTLSLSLVATLSSSVSVRSLERAESRFSSTDTATVALERPDGSALLVATPSTSVWTVLPGADAALDVVLPSTGAATVGASYVAGGRASADAALLIGTGRVTLPMATAARVSADAPGNFGAVFDSQVAASVSETATTGGDAGGGGSGGSGSTYTGSGLLPVALFGSVTTAVQHVVIDAATTGWSQALGVAGFDASLGQLETVNVRIMTSASATLRAENLGAVAGYLGTTQTATVSLLAGSDVLDSQAAAVTTGATLGAFDGTIDAGGSSGETVGPRLASTSGITSLGSAAALAAFTGTAAGVVVSGTGRTLVDGPGALSVAAALQAGAAVDVSYTYLPAAGALFDAAYYLAHNPDVAAAGVDPYQHYLQSGWREGRDPSAAFDTVDYLAANPDVKAAGVDPLLHYVQSGQGEHRAIFAVPAVRDPLVDAAYVYAQHPAVAAAGLDATTWFDGAGWATGANPDALFDPAYYLAHNPDVAAAHMNPLLHYETYGWKEGRDPSAAFSTRDYLGTYGDVAAAGVNPLAHYLQAGQGEGRVAFAVATSDPLVDAGFIQAQHPEVAASGMDAATWFLAAGWMGGANPNALFDTGYYLAHNPDVAAAHVDPLVHYETSGWKEGRDPSAAFSTAKYLAAYPDVKAAGLDPLLHYVEYGQGEHRAIFAA